jgi:hypothetical protein
MAPLSRTETKVMLGEVRMHGTKSAEVPVCAVEANSQEGPGGAPQHYYMFKLSQQSQGLWKGCWMTDGVRPAPSWDSAAPAS